MSQRKKRLGLWLRVVSAVLVLTICCLWIHSYVRIDSVAFKLGDNSDLVIGSVRGVITVGKYRFMREFFPSTDAAVFAEQVSAMHYLGMMLKPMPPV